MSKSRSNWRNTTHEWAKDLDVDHLEQIRRESAVIASGGLVHLLLEVLAYAADEATRRDSGQAVVTLHADGSVSVADNGRGTDTRVDDQGRLVKKPVMATKDLRFFDSPGAAMLPDGCPRRGISIVAALSEWLVHTNRRRNGSWTQRYEYGLPATDLKPIPQDGTTGTTVHFLPDAALVSNVQTSGETLRRWAAALSPHLRIEVNDDRG